MCQLFNLSSNYRVNLDIFKDKKQEFAFDNAFAYTKYNKSDSENIK